jgi:hypothetical protein
MALSKIYNGTPYSVTATNASSAVATQTGVAGQFQYITDIAGSSDKAGSLLLVKQGSTVIWQVQLATSAAGINAFSHTFASPLVGIAGGSVSVTVDGTSACYANIAGYSI